MSGGKGHGERHRKMMTNNKIDSIRIKINIHHDAGESVQREHLSQCSDRFDTRRAQQERTMQAYLDSVL